MRIGHLLEFAENKKPLETEGFEGPDPASA